MKTPREQGLPASSDEKGSAHNMGDLVFNSWVEKIPEKAA